jgi:hypothetical protein
MALNGTLCPQELAAQSGRFGSRNAADRFTLTA